MRDHLSAVVFWGCFAMIMIPLYCTVQHRKDDWKTVREGEFSYIVYGEYDYTKRVGSMVHHDEKVTMRTAAIYFTDGRTYVVEGRPSIPFPTGTHIRILENGLGDYRIKWTR